ncbi:MAG TPA: ROK family protein [Anaerolineaceae bacterium]|nr:ROK family protein [Anaerolineaceae bacterium]
MVPRTASALHNYLAVQDGKAKMGKFFYPSYIESAKINPEVEMNKKLYAAIEGGGTKFICAVIDSERKILSEARFPCQSPSETISNCLNFFQNTQSQLGLLSALGIASFGPLDPRPESPQFGRILATPKPGWANTDLVSPFVEALGIPVAFDTDVNGAVLAESLWGAGKGLKNLVYYTIGTGVGGGAIVENRLIHGLMHPEMGHAFLPHDYTQDPFAGVCPFHQDCFEGLASGPAIEARWGKKAYNLPADHPAWELEAHYIALALANTTLMLAPERIILGGGVMAQRQLFPLVRAKFLVNLHGYLQFPSILEQVDSFIVPSGLEGIAGLYGALALAMQTD